MAAPLQSRALQALRPQPSIFSRIRSSPSSTQTPSAGWAAQSHTRTRNATARHVSTTSSAPHSPQIKAANIRRASSVAPRAGSEDVLTWDRFFKLRQERRLWNLGFSAITAGITFASAGQYLATQDIDTWAAQVSGMDPMIVLGLATFAAGGAGWLAGPMLGTPVFRLRAGAQITKELGLKEKSFYDRIKRYRADPSTSSPQNPIPDYYGEKISSVKDYHRWLKDQRAFNLKKNKNIL